ncbi:MAG: LytTR family DNA-binding domain-containing protein [Clostridia bacterium]|nr:LytTR family DNA-binding domain-containing protein [Clostridia bacterium]
MKIAICDDHLESMEQIYIHLTDFLRRRSIVAEILRYASAEAFSTAMDEMRFDLAFLAVAWQDYSGFALARKLRSIDVQCELAFVTSHPEFMSDVFPYRPIGYIVKPVSGQEIDVLMERFLFYCGHRDLYYTIHTRDRDYQVPHAQIRYFRSDGHHVMIHMGSDSEPLAHLRRLDDIERELAALPYLRCHQSYLVHSSNVRRFEHRRPRLILDDGTEIPVSKRYFNGVTAYLLGRNQI